MSLAGAGGGGFLYVVKKEGVTDADLRDALARAAAQDSSVAALVGAATVHAASVDEEGVRVRVVAT